MTKISKHNGYMLTPGSKTIQVTDIYNDKKYYIPNTRENRTKINKTVGKPRYDTYRGKKRIIWLDWDVWA